MNELRDSESQNKKPKKHHKSKVKRSDPSVGGPSNEGKNE
jgi:hypothetical protein